MGFFLNPFRLLWRYRSLISRTVKSDVRGRYAGSALGLVWLILYPLCFLGLYAVIYLYVWQVRPLDFAAPLDYVLYIFSGLVPFLGFAEAMGAGVPSVSGNANLIKNTLFPIELIPVKTVFASQCTQIAGMSLLVGALAATGRLTPWALLLPVVWLFQVILTLGVIWILSSLNVYLRDLQNTVSVVVLMMMLISPIAYTVDSVSERVRHFLVLNPLYHVIVSYQNILIRGRFPDGGEFYILAAMAAVFFCIGFWFFSRMKRAFADNV